MRISILTTAGAFLVTLLIASSAFARNHDILNGTGLWFLPKAILPVSPCCKPAA